MKEASSTDMAYRRMKGGGPHSLLYVVESKVFDALPCQTFYLSSGCWLSSTLQSL